MTNLVYLFFAVLVMGILESSLACCWFSPYFKYGIRIYRKVVDYSWELSSLQKKVTYLNRKFYKRTSYGARFYFKEIDHNTIAVQSRGVRGNRSPFMRGRILIDRQKRKIEVVVFLNYYPILFIVLWSAAGCDNLIKGYSLILPSVVYFIAPIVLVFCQYLRDSYHYERMADCLEKKYGPAQDNHQ